MGNEWKDEGRCARCGGKCCQINYYLPRERSSISFGKLYKAQKTDSEAAEIKPLFDITEIHMLLNNNFWASKAGKDILKTRGSKLTFVRKDLKPLKELLAKGLDPTFCPYNDPATGCIIPRQWRPDVCLEYRCDVVWLGKDNVRKMLWGSPFIPERWDADVVIREHNKFIEKLVKRLKLPAKPKVEEVS